MWQKGLNTEDRLRTERIIEQKYGLFKFNLWQTHILDQKLVDNTCVRVPTVGSFFSQSWRNSNVAVMQHCLSP